MGHPLATPWKRLLAIGIDSVFGYLFAGLGSVSVALASGFFVAYLPVRKRRSKGIRVGKTRFLLSLFLGLSTLGLMLHAVHFAGGFFPDEEATKSAAASTAEIRDLERVVSALAAEPTAADADNLKLQAENLRLREQLEQYRNRSMSFKDRIMETAGDLGLSFGWFGVYTIIALTYWNGWTPGKRLLGIRVVRLNGQPLTLWSAFERFGGYAAGTFTGLLGFLQIFWDSNRQGIQDKIGSTVVIDVRKARRLQRARNPVPPTPSASVDDQR